MDETFRQKMCCQYFMCVRVPMSPYVYVCMCMYVSIQKRTWKLLGDIKHERYTTNFWNNFSSTIYRSGEWDRDYRLLRNLSFCSDPIRLDGRETWNLGSNLSYDLFLQDLLGSRVWPSCSLSLYSLLLWLFVSFSYISSERHPQICTISVVKEGLFTFTITPLFCGCIPRNGGVHT